MDQFIFVTVVFVLTLAAVYLFKPPWWLRAGILMAIAIYFLIDGTIREATTGQRVAELGLAVFFVGSALYWIARGKS